jgi:hypothetical protein
MKSKRPLTAKREMGVPRIFYPLLWMTMSSLDGELLILYSPKG